jgi:hypothetical protein
MMSRLYTPPARRGTSAGRTDAARDARIGRTGAPAGLTLALLCLALFPTTGARGSAGAPADTIHVFPPGKMKAVMAAEDTAGAIELPPYDVTATRVPLIEIIRKAQEGERRKYAGLRTMAYNLTFKTTMEFGGRSPKSRCQETAQRVYYRAPADWRSVTLRDTTYQVDPDGTRRPWSEKDDSGVRVSAKGGRDLNELPFYLERLDKFRFRILKTDRMWPKILYEVEFEPMSDFDNLPGGRLWLLTPDYQVVREEFVLKNLPFPWVVKKVDLLTREWQPVEGRWVEKRVTGRVDLGLNFLGIPKQMEFVALFDHYQFDQPLDPGIFEGGDR